MIVIFIKMSFFLRHRRLLLLLLTLSFSLFLLAFLLIQVSFFILSLLLINETQYTLLNTNESFIGCIFSNNNSTLSIDIIISYWHYMQCAKTYIYIYLYSYIWRKRREQLYGCNHSPPLSLNQINHRERKERERRLERKGETETEREIKI